MNIKNKSMDHDLITDNQSYKNHEINLIIFIKKFYYMNFIFVFYRFFYMNKFYIQFKAINSTTLTSIINTVFPTPAPPNNPILPPLLYGANK